MIDAFISGTWSRVAVAVVLLASLVCPGAVFIAVFKPEFFQSADVTRLLIMSAAVTIPQIAFLTLGLTSARRRANHRRHLAAQKAGKELTPEQLFDMSEAGQLRIVGVAATIAMLATFGVAGFASMSGMTVSMHTAVYVLMGISIFFRLFLGANESIAESEPAKPTPPASSEKVSNT
jgi:hypothetical protein